jgi:hypothetical protein
VHSPAAALAKKGNHPICGGGGILHSAALFALPAAIGELPKLPILLRAHVTWPWQRSSVGTVARAMLIEGTMETVSKASLCVLVFGAAIKVMADLVRRLRAASRGQALPRQSLSRM